MNARPTRQPVLDNDPVADMYCLQCGYNLQGLSHDPVQCPECGGQNPRAVMQVPARAISAQLRRMETNPAVCVGAIVAAAGLSGMTVISLMDRAVLPIAGCWLICMPIFGLVWIVAGAQFADSCRYHAGWVRVLGAYHLHGLAAVAAVFLLPAAFIVLLGRWSPWVAGILGLIAFAVGICAVPRCYRRAIAGIQIVQRRVAMDMCREWHRRQRFKQLNPDARILK